MAQDATVKREYQHHIDLMRFIFSVIIVYYHILHASIMPYVTDERYAQLAEPLNYSTNIVICFFILGGVFMYRSFASRPELSIFEYIVGRVVRLWPVLVFAMLAEAVLVGKIDWNRTLINAAFLQCSGLSLENKGILWYVSSFFFSSIFLYAILRSFSRRKAAFVISLLVYFCTAFLINYNNGLIGGRDTVLYVLSIGVLRGVAFTGVGILLAIICEKLRAMLELAPLSDLSQKILFVVKAVTEILALRFLYNYFLLSKRVSNHIVLVLVFSLFLLCLLSKNDPLGLVLNRKIFGFCGKYAYSIYVMQGTSFYILQKTLWKSEAFVSNVWLALALSTAFALAVGIGTYYLVERPLAGLYGKWYKKYRTALAECNPDTEN